MDAQQLLTAYRNFATLGHINNLQEINLHNLGVDRYHGYLTNVKLFDPAVLDVFSQGMTSQCIAVLDELVDAAHEYLGNITPQQVKNAIADPKTDRKLIPYLSHLHTTIELLRANRSVSSKKLSTKQSIMSITSGKTAWSKLVAGPEDMISNMKTASSGRYPVQTFVSDKSFAFTLSQAHKMLFGSHAPNIHKMTKEQQMQVLHPIWKHVLEASGMDISGDYREDATNAMRTIHRTARTISLYHMLKHIKDQIIHSDVPDVSES